MWQDAGWGQSALRLSYRAIHVSLGMRHVDKAWDTDDDCPAATGNWSLSRLLRGLALLYAGSSSEGLYAETFDHV